MMFEFSAKSVFKLREICKIGGGASLTDLAALPLIQGTVQSADGGFGFTAVKVQLYRSNGLPEYWTGSEWSTKGSHLLDTELKAGKMVNSPSTWRRDHDLPPGASLRDGRYCIIAIAFDGDKVVGFSRAAFSIRRGPHLSIISPLSEKTYSAATMPTSLSGTAELGLAGTALTDIMYGISRFSLDGSAQGWNGKVWIKVPARIPPIPLLWVTEPGKSRKGLWKSGSDWPTRDSFTSGQYFVTVTCVDKDGKSSVSTASFKIG